MSTTIAAYFADELIDWMEAIRFYHKEMDDLSIKLGEVIRRNCITGIAEKVEAQQHLLNLVGEKFNRLHMDIQMQQEALKTDSTYIEDSFISETTGMNQSELRKRMQALEKEFIDAKFNCYEFLSGTLKR